MIAILRWVTPKLQLHFIISRAVPEVYSSYFGSMKKPYFDERLVLWSVNQRLIQGACAAL